MYYVNLTDIVLGYKSESLKYNKKTKFLSYFYRFC